MFAGAWIVLRAQDGGLSDAGVFRLASLKPGGQTGGTGFLVSGDSVLATNYHVIRGAERVSVVLDRNGTIESYPATLEAFDIDRDIALLRTSEPLPAQPLTLAPASETGLVKRAAIHAVGFPAAADDLARAVRGSESAGLTRVDPSITSGTIQRFVPGNERMMIQHSASLSPGNSGGPLLDDCGRVVGVNTFSTVTAIPNANIVDALQSGKDVGVDALGLFASAVDVSELEQQLSALQLPYLRSAAQCRYGMTVPQLAMAASLAGFAFFALSSSVGLAAASLVARKPDTRGIRDAVPHPPAENVQAFSNEKPGNNDLFAINRAAAPAAQVEEKLADDLSGLWSAPWPAEASDVSGGEPAPDPGPLFPVRDTTRTASPSAPVQGWLLSGFDESGKVMQMMLTPGAKGTGGQAGSIAIVGRLPDCEISINHPSISRKHAEFLVDEDGVLSVRDLGSTNGTSIDGVPVGDRPVPVSSTQTLQFGEKTVKISRLGVADAID